MSALQRLLLAFVVAFALASAARAQSLIVATNTLETGAQTYTFGEITNGATYTLSGAGAVLNVGGNFWVGTNTPPAGTRNGSLIVTNGAIFNQTSGSFFASSDASLSKTSSILVSGAVFTNTSSPLTIGNFLGADSLIINNGSQVRLSGVEMFSGKSYLEISGGSKVMSSARFRLSLGNTSAEFTDMVVKGQGTQLFITNGGGVGSGKLVLGGLGSARLTMSDGALITNANGLSVGAANASSYAMGSATGWLYMSSGAVITNGQASSGPTIMFGGYNNNNGPGIGVALLTDPGTILTTMAGQNASIGVYGSNDTYRSMVVVSNGAFLGNTLTASIEVRAGTLLAVDGGIIHTDYGFRTDTTGAGAALAGFSNIGGVFQFGGWNPVIATNGGAIVVQNGTISFRGINNASVTADISGNGLTNLTYLGTNSFQLNNASNTSVAYYNFSASYGATNWAALRLTGATSGWRSSTVRFDNNASLLITNTFAAVGGVVTNAGSTRVMNSKVTFQGPVVLSGSYFSDPSTNTFNSNLTVTASGSLYGSNGDLFVFNRDFLNGSTNRSAFNLAFASVLFTNGTGTTNHTLSLVGSDAFDKGSNWLGITDLATNFAVGTLSLAAGNTLSITGAMGGGVSNALYVGVLDLQGLTDTNQLGSRLWLGINLYYDEHQSGNAYLHGLTYDLPGLGLLIPIPEPSALAAALAGLGLFGFLRGRCRRGR